MPDQPGAPNPQLAALMAARQGGGAPPAPGGAPGGASPGGPAPMPPSLQAGPPGTGGVQGPQGNPGNTLAAIAKVKTALTLIQTALPSIPMGSDFHNDILKALPLLTKHIPDVGQGADQQQI